MTSIDNSNGNQDQSNEIDNFLNISDLDHLENQVFQLMNLTNDTLKELQNIPRCNEDKLIELAQQYQSNIHEIHSNLKKHSEILKDEQPMSNLYAESKYLELLSSSGTTTPESIESSKRRY